ncbi:MAG: FMN-binding protein [Tissierellia bacterium]|nr:FMN-binding protein [Tissierellia bacterium]
MKNRKFYIIFLIVIVALVAFLFISKSSISEEEKLVRSFYPHAKDIKLIKDIADDMYISLNFPAVKRAYEVDGKVKAYVSSCVGYVGPIDVLVAIDGQNHELIGIEILRHEETPRYAEYIEEDWFLERFKNIIVDKYLNLVVLDKENPEDIVQVTGATISSQAIVNAVNAAIGAYNYINHGIEMASVPDVVPQELWSQDTNSFAINWEEGSLRIDVEKIKEYEAVEMDVVLINTTGTETEMTVKGATLRNILEQEGLDLDDFAGIGVTGRDGYYTLIDRDKLMTGDVILAWEVDGKPLKEEEKPVRLVVPKELGPYWVKMVSNIDLYDEISPKDIEKVHIFDPLTEDIEPYYYEYYGSKDKSIEVGQILRKFDQVDEKGFFTMAAVDGLIKNETISLVRQRYYIKVEGDNAPMNISPNFKLGMNVKHMTHFSTTKDAVIFPHMMKEVVRTKDIAGKEGMLLEDVLLTAGMRWEEGHTLAAISVDEREVKLSLDDIVTSYLVQEGDRVDLYDENEKILDNILRIERR